MIEQQIAAEHVIRERQSAEQRGAAQPSIRQQDSIRAERRTTAQELAELLGDEELRLPKHVATAEDAVSGGLFRRWFRRGHGLHCAEHAEHAEHAGRAGHADLAGT